MDREWGDESPADEFVSLWVVKCGGNVRMCDSVADEGMAGTGGASARLLSAEEDRIEDCESRLSTLAASVVDGSFSRGSSSCDSEALLPFPLLFLRFTVESLLATVVAIKPGGRLRPCPLYSSNPDAIAALRRLLDEAGAVAEGEEVDFDRTRALFLGVVVELGFDARTLVERCIEASELSCCGCSRRGSAAPPEGGREAEVYELRLSSAGGVGGMSFIPNVGSRISAIGVALVSWLYKGSCRGAARGVASLASWYWSTCPSKLGGGGMGSFLSRSIAASGSTEALRPGESFLRAASGNTRSSVSVAFGVAGPVVLATLSISDDGG